MFSASDKPSNRFIFGLILLISLALYSGWQSVKYYNFGILTRQYQNFGNFSSDSISRLERRLSCLEGKLSINETVGFVSSHIGEDREITYRWTQYAMAPVVVVNNESHARLIDVFSGNKDLQQARSDGHSVLFDCGNGVALLKRGANQ